MRLLHNFDVRHLLLVNVNSIGLRYILSLGDNFYCVRKKLSTTEALGMIYYCRTPDIKGPGQTWTKLESKLSIKTTIHLAGDLLVLKDDLFLAASISLLFFGPISHRLNSCKTFSTKMLNHNELINS